MITITHKNPHVFSKCMIFELGYLYHSNLGGMGTVSHRLDVSDMIFEHE